VVQKATSDKVAELYEKIIKAKDEEIARLCYQNDSIIKKWGLRKV